MITIQKAVDGVSEATLLRFTNRAKAAIRLRGDVSLLLTSSRKMRHLNRCFRGKDKPTDVISFPAVEAVADKFAGDVAISVDIAAANARLFGHSLQDELRVLILHGLLHLAGYDHEVDHGEMARQEERLRRRLGLPANLIARAEQSLKGVARKQVRVRRVR